jgi:hypothetical protein
MRVQFFTVRRWRRKGEHVYLRLCGFALYIGRSSVVPRPTSRASDALSKVHEQILFSAEKRIKHW